VALVGLVLVPGSATALRPETDYVDTPAKHGLTADAVTFATKDGLTLSGWFFPAKDSARGTVIVSETDAGNMSYLIPTAGFYVDTGFNVLLYDYRGFGASQEFDTAPDALIYPEYLFDLNAAVDFVKPRVQGPIVLLGLSIGSTVSIAVAAQRQDIAAVIVDGVYSTTHAVAKAIKDEHGDDSLIPSTYPETAEPVRAVTHFTDTALLILAGSADKITTPAMAFDVYSSCSAAMKSLWIAPGAVHLRIPEVVGDLYFLHIRGFLDTVLGPRRSAERAR
jgi:fermentation-respiration switch protein FrsA (DUF1100 family)